MPNSHRRLDPSLDGPLSDQTLDRLRVSAAMAIAIPQMAVQVRAGGTTCIEVRRTPVPGASHRVLPPCLFHHAVAGAVRMRRSGERVAMRGVPAGSEPAIDWGVAAGARLLPGGLIRLDDGDAWRHVAPILADRRHVTTASASTPGLAASVDEALEVTIVEGDTSRGDKLASRAMVDAIIELIARAGVADLEQRLTGTVRISPEASTWR